MLINLNLSLAHGERGTQACNGGLGLAPIGGFRAEPLVMGQNPVKLKAFWLSDMQRRVKYVHFLSCNL